MVLSFCLTEETNVDVYLRSAGTAVPGPAVDNSALARLFEVGDVWEQWIDTFIGTRTRHLCVNLETGEIYRTLADLGETAAARALAAAGLEPGEIDLIVMGTSSPDQLLPATVNVIADRLGIDGIPSFQLQSGCSGALQAFDLARQLVLGGRHRHALVIGGDTGAKHYDLTADPSELPQTEKVNAAMFGDGVGAAVLSREPGPDPVTVAEVRVRLAGGGREPGHTVDWFGMADRDNIRPATSEDYKAVEALVPRLAVEVLGELLETLGWKPQDLNYLLPPQLSGRMTAKIVEELALPGAIEISCVQSTGNTGNALPFFQLEQLLPRLAAGDRAVAIAIESSKWIKSALALEKP
jgi:3-oxoacyl-[acyl-carrier-protein] synthase III